MVKVGSEEECRGFAVRATIGGGGRWERSVRWMQILKNNWKLFYNAGIGSRGSNGLRLSEFAQISEFFQF